jgi:hypothetical protein
MEAAAIDALVSELYDRAGADEGEPPGPLALARALLGHDAVLTVPPSALPGDASLARVEGSWRIYVRRGLPPERAGFAVAHELAEWRVRAEGGTEAACDALGAALITPRPAFLRALGRSQTVTEVAATFGSTESLAWLRIGEVTGTPLCLVAPTTVRVRGRPYAWPANENELRGLAKGRRRGLVKTRLRDDKKRTAVVAAQLSFPF